MFIETANLAMHPPFFITLQWVSKVKARGFMSCELIRVVNDMRISGAEYDFSLYVAHHNIGLF